MNNELKQLSITISGRVQGVFFRKTAATMARNLELAGYVENTSDGKVHLLAQGRETALKKLLEWCYRGSMLAHVEGLSFAWETPQTAYTDFTIKRSGGTVFEDKFRAARELSKHLFDRHSFATLPRHVVIIPDGNRRWAREHNLPIWRGHQKGFDRAFELVREMKRLGIRYVTLWGFSTENWTREHAEVERLMDIFLLGVKKFRSEALQEHIRFHHFGRTDRLPERLRAAMEELERATASFEKYHFGFAIDYGGRDELLRAVEKMQNAGEPISEAAISNALDTNGFPDPDLIIRTSGEQRLSGIMPWQGVYAELYFAPMHFPDFDIHALHLALADFAARGRRFGGGK